MSNKIIVGLDIGTTKIACFVGQRDEVASNKVSMLGYGKTESAGVVRGVVMNIVTTADSIKRAVAMAADQADVDIKEVYVGIAGQHIKSYATQGSIMVPPDHKFIMQEDVDKLISDQHHMMLPPGEKIIHIFPQSYIVDGTLLNTEVNPVGVVGNQLKGNFHVVTANDTNITNIRDAVLRAGLKIQGVVLEPVASAYAALDERDREAGAALVDIGGGTTDIAIFQNGHICHTSVLPLAGNAITNDICEGCGIMRPQAETLKTRFGSCLPQEVSENDVVSVPGLRNQAPREIAMKTLAGIIKARTETILDQVNLEITQSDFGKHLIAGLVLTGGGAQLRNIKDLTAYITGIDTRIGLPNEHITGDLARELSHPMYATGIGLVLYGIMETEAAERQGVCEDPDETEAADPIEQPADPQPSPASTPNATKTSEPSEEKSVPQHSKKDKWYTRLKNYLDKVINEPNADDVDKEE